MTRSRHQLSSNVKGQTHPPMSNQL